MFPVVLWGWRALLPGHGDLRPCEQQDGSGGQQRDGPIPVAAHSREAAVDRYVYVQAGLFVTACAAVGAALGAIVALLREAL